MAPRSLEEPPINVEWAESLIWLSTKVAEYWWDGCNAYKLHDGKIDSFDISEQKWNLLLDTQDDDDLYLMAYSAVCEYSDEASSTFDEYHLTYHAVLDGDEEIESAQGTRYSKTPVSEWNQVEDGEGWLIDPIECAVDEDFSVKITDEEVKLLMDDSKEIRYEKVFQWCLPRYGDEDESLFEYQAARMQDYMTKRIVEEGYKPRYYTGGKVITGDHVADFTVLVLVKCLLVVDPLIRYLQLEKSLMQYHQYKQLWQRAHLKTWLHACITATIGNLRTMVFGMIYTMTTRW
jgi:hypothetical protein